MRVIVAQSLFELQHNTSVRIDGNINVFPVNRVFCVGRNYAEHAAEMGNTVDRSAPFYFTKSPQSVIHGHPQIKYPTGTQNYHHEVEFVVFIGVAGHKITADAAMDHVFGYACGLDMTRRDLQGEAKKMGRPWEIGKAFERSAPMSELVPASDTGHLDQGRIALQVNGADRQIGDLNQMIWKVPEMIAYLSRFYDIAAGDLIMSGTPAGVGPIERGDVMIGEVEGIGSFTVTVV